jgi:hypothetical protein
MINFKKHAQKGEALLYTILLIGALMLISELSYSYIVFSLKSRAESYTSQVNYWLAWGGAEASLVEINDYDATNKTTAFAQWPKPNSGINLIDKNTITGQYKTIFTLLNAAKANTFVDNGSIGGAGDYIQTSAAYFTAVSPQDKTTDPSLAMAKDQSDVFDLSQFSGNLTINFNIDSSNVSKNLLWFRLEQKSGAHNILEAILQASVDSNGKNLSINLVSSPNGSNPVPPISGFTSSCSGSSCLITIRGFGSANSQYRFAKIKVFQGSADLTFNLNNGSALGMPDTVIHSIGEMKANDPNQKELYIKFPNQLKSISDVLDYSVYQACFSGSCPQD